MRYIRPVVVGLVVATVGILFGARVPGRAASAPPPLSECQCKSTSVDTTMMTANGPRATALSGATISHCRCGALQCVATFYSVSGTGTAISCH